MRTSRDISGMGPFRADQLRAGDPYELSDGRLIECMPTGQRGAKSTSSGAALLGTDPEVKVSGVDAGVSPEPSVMRAPDISIGGTLEDESGWAKTAPPLAVEYADTGQDEASLRQKISELLKAGTKWIWVIRLHGPKCVEVHSPGAPVRIARIGDILEAPGVLRNPVPVSALYDDNEAKRLTLRNLLQREGYESLDEVRKEARFLESRGTLRRILERRKLPLSPAVLERINSCTNLETLARWIDNAIVAKTAAEALE